MLGANRLARVKAAHFRHHHIQHHHIRAGGRQPRDALARPGGVRNDKVMLRQILGQQLAQGAIVVNHQDAFFHLSRNAKKKADGQILTARLERREIMSASGFSPAWTRQAPERGK